MRLNLSLILLLFAMPLATTGAASSNLPVEPPRAALLNQIDQGMANAVAWEYAFNAIASCDVARIDHTLRNQHDSHPVQVQPLLDAGYTATYRTAEPYPALQDQLAMLRDAEIACMAVADGRSHANVIDRASALLAYIAGQPL
ncbi:hypothetical protein [Stenotrophomonas sp. DR009]|uniref:hypothetical protein n=1 Tax=Stenotrophomonas sp. DR009 TaxID=3398461 RepID=UPI003BB120D7